MYLTCIPQFMTQVNALLSVDLLCYMYKYYKTCANITLPVYNVLNLYPIYDTS